MLQRTACSAILLACMTLSTAYAAEIQVKNNNAAPTSTVVVAALPDANDSSSTTATSSGNVHLFTGEESPLAGRIFLERPFVVPIEKDLAVSMENSVAAAGRFCGERAEAWGWTTPRTATNRLPEILSVAFDALRAQKWVLSKPDGSAIQPPTTITQTAFSVIARKDKQELFILNTLGPDGLIIALCEAQLDDKTPDAQPDDKATAKAESTTTDNNIIGGKATAAENTGYENQPDNKASSLNEEAIGASSVPRMARALPKDYVGFSPKGKWSGRYTCNNETRFASFTLQPVKGGGGEFSGVFTISDSIADNTADNIADTIKQKDDSKTFSKKSASGSYKNGSYKNGSYKISATYDSDTGRIILNPGEWVKRVRGYEPTVIAGRFYPASASFSGIFQGLSGCTSLEAKQQ